MLNATRGLILSAFLCLVSFTAAGAGYVDNGSRVIIEVAEGSLELIPMSANTVRVKLMLPERYPIEELIYLDNIPVAGYSVAEDEKEIVVSLNNISVVFDKSSQTLTFKDGGGNVILKETVGGRSIRESSIQGEPTCLVEQKFISEPGEYLYGTGQFQDGYLNIKGLSRRLTQVNTQISIPFILSSKGYGLLWNNYGLTDFNPADNKVGLIPALRESETIIVDATTTTGNTREERTVFSFGGSIEVPVSGRYSLLLDVGQNMARKHYLSIDGINFIDESNIWLPPTTSVIVELDAGTHNVEVRGDKHDIPILYWREVVDETVFRSPVAQALDYTVFAGNADQVMSSYRELTGPAPMMPLWALGYIHCRERYNSQDELLENAREFRRRQLPIDLIVQDWQYWGKYGWNAMKFDEERYPDPSAMVSELHGMNIRLMLSVWSKIDRQSDLGKMAGRNGYYIADTEWIDFFNPDASGFYWDNFRERLLPYGIDAWWQDATEPENDDLKDRRVGKGRIPGEFVRNVYPMYVSKVVYEGLRRDNPGKRAMIFTRSGFSGMQRYAAATWSGDVGHDWETLRRQITGGLGQMAAGLPWWTYDAGGFFRPHDQYTNTDYHEQFIRWFQAGTFFPMMRVHGYMSNTELWRYGTEVENITSKYLDLRYRLLPYIYSRSAAVSFAGSTLMRPMVMDFAGDHRALEQRHQFMFGPAILVAPVVEPGRESWDVYLPESEAGWVDFWTGEKTCGGQNIKVSVSLEKTPLFVKAGSVLPMGPVKQYASQDTDEPWEIRIYPGADGRFTVYEDDGGNYDYEKGLFSTFDLVWDDNARMFTIGKRAGSFPGMKNERGFNVVVVSPQEGIGIYTSPISRIVRYSGEEVKINF